MKENSKFGGLSNWKKPTAIYCNGEAWMWRGHVWGNRDLGESSADSHEIG